MAGTRVEKYRKYRKSIVARSDNIPVLKTPSSTDQYASEKGFLNEMTFKRRMTNFALIGLIVCIVVLLIVFGFILF